MKPITYYLNFPLARQIQDCLDRLSTDQKIELAFAIGQRALDEKRSADVIRRDMDNPVDNLQPDILFVDDRQIGIVDGIELVSIEVNYRQDFVSFICDDCEMESYQRFTEGEDRCIGCDSFEMA
jgi:hypothetical protein